MPQRFLRFWPTAFLAGIGAFLFPHLAARGAVPPSGGQSGTALVKIENDRVMIAEGDSSFEPLDVGDTPEAVMLRDLIRRLSPDGSVVRIPVDRRIVADGGVSTYRRRAEQKQHEQPARGR